MKTMRIILLASAALLLSASFAFADIAPLPPIDPAPGGGGGLIAAIVGAAAAAAAALIAIVKKRKK